MSCTRSYLDLLFLLLCAALVLAQDAGLAVVDGRPVRLGGGGLSSVRASGLRRVVVEREGYRAGPAQAGSLEELIQGWPSATVVLVSPQDEALPHDRVMRAWSRLRELGMDARLAVRLGSR